MLNDLNLSDMETGHKAIRRSVLESIDLKESGFGIEAELTAKLARRDCRFYEVPISYSGRSYEEGKKVGLWDALATLWCLLRYRLGD